jgi:ADP-heptose:LPS heptosyltransferase
MFNFISLKAYGDFIILLNTLKCTENYEYSIVAGQHLKDLYDSLDCNFNIKFLNTGNSLPAIYDIKDCGLAQSLSSFVSVRNEFLNRLNLNTDKLVFDSIGFREFLLGRNFHCFAINKENTNIYQNYFDFFGLRSKCVIQKRISNKKVYIFPESRVTSKSISENNVRTLAKKLLSLNLEPIVVRFNRSSISPLIYSSCLLYHDFYSLTSIIRSGGLIISCDSLPAHLAEYYNLPIFVLNNFPNKYWLPYSSYINNNWCLTNDFNKITRWVNAHT